MLEGLDRDRCSNLFGPKVLSAALMIISKNHAINSYRYQIFFGKDRSLP
jgi:hypothetical protein